MERKRIRHRPTDKIKQQGALAMEGVVGGE
jgi:hypothetical protein